ncbi:uncharacterized protein LOC123542358 [Mercenaria mercenaria]|uniref:uncharacterized protein LOC123542358 n=1 Tax=Mercenaria mercenaria TaxID=6596 RepID=UPI00234E3D3F|nr:uncharacterized protein LOC123542358 [Mercenaria mercenaria]
MANKLIFLFPVFILQVLQLWTRLTECIPAVPSQAETANSRMHSLMAPNVGSRQWFHADSRSSNPHIQLFKSNESGLPSNAKDMLKGRMPTSQSGERRIYTTWSSKDSTPNNDVGGSLSRPAFLQTRINVGAPNIGNGVYKTWSSENPSFQANGAITKSSDSPSKVLFKKHVAEPDISLFKSLSTNSPDLSNVQNVWFSGPSNGPDSMKGENGWLPASSNVPDSRNRKSVWLSGNINKSTEPMLQNLLGFPEINNVSDGRTSVFRTWSSGHPFSNEISHSIPSQVFYKVNNGNVTKVDKQTLSPWSSKDSYTRPNFENPHFGNLHHTDELNKATKAKFGLKGNNNKNTDERIETLQPFPYIGYQTDSLLNDTASENFHTMFDKLMTPTSIPSSSEHFINLPESIRKRIEAQRSRLSTSSANHPAEISYRFPPVSSVHNNKRKTTDNGRKKGSDIDRIFKRLPLPEFKRNHLKLSSLEIQDKLKNVVSDWIGNHSAVGQQKKNLSDTTKENQESTKVKNVNINANSTRIPASTETGKGTSEKNSRHFTLFPPIDLFGRTVIPNRKETNDGKLLESGHNRFKNGSPSPENAISERKKKNGDKTLSPSGKNVSENILKSPITVFKQQDNKNPNTDSHKKRKLKDEKMKKVSTIKTKIPENEQVRYYSDQSSESLINRRGQPRQSKTKKQVLKPKQNEKNMNEVLLSPLLERKTVKNDVSALRLLLGPQINETLNADDKNATLSTHLVGNYQNRRDITKSTAKNKQNQKKRSSKPKTKSKEYPKNKKNLKTESPQDQRNTGNNSKSLTKETPGNNKVIQLQKSFPTDKRTQEVVPKTLQDGSQKLHLFNNSTANKERHRNLTKLTTIKATNKETRINQTQNTPENTIKLPKGAKIKGNRTLKSNISTPYLPMSENTPKLLPKQANDVGRREHKSNPVMTLKINRLNTTSLTKLKTREKDDQNQTLSTFITTNSTTKNTTNLISDAKVKGNTTLKSNVSITTADIIVNTTNLLPEQANEMDYREGNFTPITTTKKIHRNTTNLVRVKVHNIDHMNKTLNTSIITTLTTINRTDLITLTNENGNQTLLSNISTTNIEVTKNTTHVLPEQENDMNHKEGNSTTTAATKEKNQNVTRVITVKTHNTSITTTTTLNSTIKENNNITLTSNRSTSATENLRNKTKRLQENANGVDRNEQTSTAPTTVEEKLSKTTVLLPLLASRKSYKSNDSESKNDVLLSHLSKVTAKESIPKSSEKLIESLSYTHTPLSEMKVVSKYSETQKYVPTEIPTIRDSLKLNVEIKNEKGNKDKTIDLSIAKQLPNNLKKLKQRNKENGQHIYDSSKEIYAKYAKVKRRNETIASLDLEKMKTLNPINYSVLSKHENTSGEMNNSANYKTSDNTLSHFLAQPSDIEQKINTLGTERKELRMDNLLANYNTDTSLRPEVTNEMAYTGYTTIPTVTSVFKDPSHVSRETTESTNTNKAIAQNTTPILPVARQTDFIVNSTKHKNYIFTKAGMKDSATNNIDLPSPPIFVKKNKESLPPIAESAAKNIELPPPPITLKKNIETFPPIDKSAAKNIELPPPPITLKKNIETLPPIDESAAKNIELPPPPITLKKNIETLPPIDEYAAKSIELPPSPITLKKNIETLPPIDEYAAKSIELPPSPITLKKNIETLPPIDEYAAKNIELPPSPITLKKNIETLPPIDESAAKNIELPPPPITLKKNIETLPPIDEYAAKNIELPPSPITLKKNIETLPPIDEYAAKNIELPPSPITLKKNIETLPPIDEYAAKNIELPPSPITLKKNIETLPPIDEYAAKNIELPPSPITLKKNIETLPPIDEYAAKNIELPPSPIVVRKNKESLPPIDESAPKNIELPPPPIIVKKNIESFPSIDTSSLYVFPELKQSQRNLKHLEMGTNAHINSLEPANNKQHLYTTLRKEPQHIAGRREHVNDVKLDDQGSKTSKIKQISHRNEINREVQTSVKESRTSKKYVEERQQKLQSPVQPLAPSQRDLKTDVVKANVYDVYEVASSPKNVRHPNILTINQKPTSKVSSAKLLEKVLTENTGNTIELFSLPKLKERTRHVSTPNRPDNFAKSSSYTVNNYSSNIKEPYGKQDKKSISISILELVYNNLPKIRKDLVPRKPKLRNTNVPKKSIVNFAPYKELTKGYATTSKILVPKAKTPQRNKKVKNSLPQRLVYPYTKDKRNTFELLQNEPKSEVKETDASNYFQKSQTSIKSPPYEPNEVGNIGHETRNGIHILNSLLSGGIRRGNKAQLFHVSPRADQQKASNVHLRRGAISVNEKPSFSKIINIPKKKLINTDLDTTKTNYLIRDMNVDQLRSRHNSRSTPLSSFDNRNTHTNKLTGVNSQGRADSNVNNIHRNANRSPNDWIKYFNIMSQQSPLANKIVLNRQLLDTTASKEQHQMFVDAAGKRKRNNKINTLENFKNAQMLEPILRKYEKTDSETPKENSIQSSHSAYKVRQNIHHVNEKRQNDALPTKDAYLHDTRKARKTRVISLWDPAALLKRLSASEYNTAVENLKLPQ